MYSFNAMYQAEAYRQNKLNDASMYRQHCTVVLRVRLNTILAGLLAGNVLASWYKPLS
jgi:hypothetical protein